MTGVPARASELLKGPDTEALIDSQTGAGDQLRAWAQSFAPAVIGLLTLAVGGAVLVSWLRRMGRSAADVHDRDASLPGEGDSDGDGLGGDEESDDGSDDEDELATSAGISDDVECVECGAELEFGYDGDFCEECEAKG
jgi:hypothetical protein